MTRVASVRALAARALADVIRGRSLDGRLAPLRADLDSAADRALLGALVYGTVRHFYSNAALVRAMLKRPGQALQPRVQALLMLGIEQLRHTRIPPHAAVAETVAAAPRVGAAGAKGLVNALLRRYTREHEALLAGLASDREARWEHPAWLIDELARHWPERWQDILRENNRSAPLWLRVNLARDDRAAYERRLAARPGLTVEPGRHSPAALCVTPSPPVTELPGFADGRVSVQDQSAQLAAGILAPSPGERILDACAAPGGKTGHLLESARDLDVVALDCAPQRLVRLEDNLARLGLSATVAVADLAANGPWRALAPFDKILLDAPCTGSGVIRRHPDIKVLRRAADSAKLCVLQSRLLGSVWSLLKPGGTLLYATCSVLPTENDDVVGAFLARTDDADRIALDPPSNWGVETRFGRQVFPGGDASDGFYYAYIAKRAQHALP